MRTRPLVAVLLPFLLLVCAACGGGDRAGLEAVDAQTGKQLWRTTIDSDWVDVPQVYGDIVVMNATDSVCSDTPYHRVFLDVRTGHVLRRPKSLPNGSISNPDVAGGIEIVSDDEHVQALDRAGRVVWSHTVPVSSRLSFQVVDGRVFIPYRGADAYAGCGD